MSAIFRRELAAYFRSPLGYIYLAISYFFSGQFFTNLLGYGANRIEYVYSSLFSILLFTIPILTMRLMSEDKRLKTDQALLTAPVSLSGIVWGKFLAAFSLFAAGIGVTVVYFFIMASMATPTWNIFFGNLLGIMILGAALISIGLFVSSLTESQMIAAIGAFAVMFFIWMIESIQAVMPFEWLAKVFGQLSFMSRYNDFTSGILNLSHVLFFVSVCAVFNFLTVRILERKRWS